MPIPKSIHHAQMLEALKPLCDLLGTSPQNFYDSPGIKIGDREITFVVPIRHEENPSGRAVGTRATDATVSAPHPQGLVGVEPVVVGDEGDEFSFAEIAYPVRVEIEGVWCLI